MENMPSRKRGQATSAAVAVTSVAASVSADLQNAAAARAAARSAGGRGAGTGKRRAASKGASAAARDALVADARGAPPVLAYPPGSSGDAIAAAAAAAAAATAAAAAAAIGAHPRSLAAPVARRPRPGHPLERVIAEDAAKNSSPSGMRAAATLFTSAVMRNAAPCAAAPLRP